MTTSGKSPSALARGGVPDGETLYLWDSVRPPAMFYLAAEPTGLAEALRAHGQAFVCMQVAKDASSDLPQGWRRTELARATSRRGERVLLRVESASHEAVPRPDRAGDAASRHRR